MGQTAFQQRARSAFTSGGRAQLVLLLLAFVSTGTLWNNVVLFRFGSYRVTMVTLAAGCLLVLGASHAVAGHKPRLAVTLAGSALLLYELAVHGLWGHLVGNPEWLKSFGLLAMSVGLLVVTGGVRADRPSLRRVCLVLAVAAYLLAGLGVVQVVLANTLGVIWLPIPEHLRASDLKMQNDALRFGGLVRATGLSYEPSYYGLGMVVLGAWCWFLAPVQGEGEKAGWIRRASPLAAILGVVLSLSFTAWAVLALTVAAIAVQRGGWRPPRGRAGLVLFLGVLALLSAAILVWPFIEVRLTNAYRSWDYRLVAPLALIAQPGDGHHWFSSFSGIGVGLDTVSERLLYVYTKELYFSNATRDIRTANGWAYVAVTMGWIGLCLHGCLLAAILRPRHARLRSALVPAALALGYFFGIGRYHDPDWWALLAFLGFVMGNLEAPIGDGSRAAKGAGGTERFREPLTGSDGAVEGYGARG